MRSIRALLTDQKLRKRFRSVCRFPLSITVWSLGSASISFALLAVLLTQSAPVSSQNLDTRKSALEGRVLQAGSDEPIGGAQFLSLIHISEPTRLLSISYAVFC